MNITRHLTYGLAALTLALTPSARANPPQPNAQGQICLPPGELEKVCRDDYCPPAPDCPSKVARPRIPRSKCTDHYKDGPGIGICLNEDDARRLESLEGVIIERGPDNLCPWGKSYHCFELDVERVTEYVDRPVDRVVERKVEVKVIDPETQRALEEAQRRIQELERLNKTGSGNQGGSGSGSYPSQKPQNELSFSLGGLARYMPNGADPVFNASVRYQRRLGDYLFLGVEGIFLYGDAVTNQSASLGTELLADGNTKSWTDITSTTTDGLTGGIGGVLGVRIPLTEIGNVQVYSDLVAGLYALWGAESGDKERTTRLSLPDGTTFLGPKTISEPKGEDITTKFGVSANAGFGIRIPLSDAAAFTGSINALYFFIPSQNHPHSFGGTVKAGVEY